MRLRFAGLFALIAFLLVARPARAFTYGSRISVGCHERITTATFRQIRTELATAPSIAPSSDETALISDLPFGVEDDMKDLAGASLLIGVRDNDLKGHSPTELDELSFVHGNPNNQEEHCLRSASQDEPNGTQEAIAACRAFIRNKIAQALDGLDAQGLPDPSHRTDIDVNLSLRGSVGASLPLFYAFMGQALHAMQDSFAHDFRTADRKKITTSMNYIEYVDGTEVESRDGPLHRTGMDACDNIDEFRTNNIAVAQQASHALLHEALDPALSHDQKLAAVDATLDEYLTFEPGCTVDNQWCNAQEQSYEVAQSCGCSTVGRRAGGLLAAIGGALAVGLLVVRRRRAALLPIVLLALAMPRVARADDPPPAPVGTDPSTGAAVAADQGTPPAGVPTVSEAEAEQKEEAHQRLFGVYAAISGSVTNPAFNQQIGVRFRISKLLSLGLDGELNNSFGVNNGKFRTLAANIYATGIFHYPIRFAAVNLRSTVNIGTSTLLIDLYGASSGTTGIYLGAVPLGLEYKLSKRFYLVFDALGVALPVPQLKGAPYGYVQYRTAVGIELSF